MKRIFFIIALFVSLCSGQDRSLTFQETWGYLYKGEDSFLIGTEPLTDICYFSARLNDIGRLDQSITPPTLPGRLSRQARLHLVISAPASKTLMYLCLNKDLHTRSNLIQDIVRLSQPFQGIQIDFEAMRDEEGSAYLSFLSELKRQLGQEKILSVAVPARTKLLHDAFSYAGIAAVVDKVLVMAYDEHWRTGPPGAIASAQWCAKVCRFAQTHIPAHKLVMGLPLYGRIWQKEDVARALKYPETLKLWEQDRPRLNRLPDETPFFEFQQKINAIVYFEDIKSLTTKLSLYQNSGVRAVGFWRIGQGPAALWEQLSVK
jgi:spore germination protein YaaH